ncbi:MAG: hypothetical protein HYX94_10160 [Chloroflexi bacterium]|nr:hypothetical protein [Chloroflexota bacterium]
MAATMRLTADRPSGKDYLAAITVETRTVLDGPRPCVALPMILKIIKVD